MQFVSLTADLSPQLPLLFDGERPIPIRLCAILDGTISDRIVVDDLKRPTIALVQELAEGTTYLGGHVTTEALAEGIAILPSYQEVVICLWPDDALANMLPAHPDYEVVAIDFTDRSQSVGLSHLAQSPPGYRIHKIDESIVPSLHGFDYYISMFGGLEQSLQQTVGYCLPSCDTVVSEAVAGPFSRGLAELGVGTNEGYRRQGLATSISARVIQECETRKYQAFWNAAQQNVASVTLAKRLGLQTEQPFRVFAWSAIT